MLCLCYQALGDNKFKQLRSKLENLLNQQGNGLPELQQQVLQKIDYQSLTVKIDLANAEP
ncbi:hypothetical protein [Photobacterium sanguinicancri]|uniref:hypothetical protein n=1 Tax=Photobacterium sanguinicancri TaxID=875932 RepID=UPI001F14E283|nr:hypothetical protein [Photobacterium sanguinicancri]